jgi:hypothetical protein
MRLEKNESTGFFSDVRWLPSVSLDLGLVSMGPALRLSWKVGRQNGEPKRRPVPPRIRQELVRGESW